MLQSTALLLGLAYPLASTAAGLPQFLPGEDCALCHKRIPGKSDWNDAASWVGPAHLWPQSMMASSSRDPVWRERVAWEVGQVPGARQEVEDTCLRCHAPAQHYVRRTAGKQLALSELDDGGRDGVTCTVCHQITPGGLGTESSFTGSFTIGLENRIYGPHRDPFQMPMLHHTGYSAAEGRHILESSLCGTCHTVITRPHGVAPAGKFVEQAPFLEWLASDYPRQGQTCQSCHVPQLMGETGAPAAQYIAHRPPGGAFPPTRPRTPFGLHYFAGANVMVATFLENREAAERARQQLSRSLSLSLSAVRTGNAVRAEVRLANHAGHKLPTGFPGRRLWLHAVVESEAGETLWESGAWNPATGELTTGDQPNSHYAVVNRPEQTQVFEATMEDASGRDTRSIVLASRYRKDNRVLPTGFDLERVRPWPIGAAGTAADPGFVPGSSTTVYLARLPEGTGKVVVRVEALYQTMRPRDLPPGSSLPVALRAPVVAAAARRAL